MFDEHSEILINKFKCKFEELYDKLKLPMTLKIHVIVDHYSEYFKETEFFLDQQMVNIMKQFIAQLRFLNQKKVST